MKVLTTAWANLSLWLFCYGLKKNQNPKKMHKAALQYPVIAERINDLSIQKSLVWKNKNRPRKIKPNPNNMHKLKINENEQHIIDSKGKKHNKTFPLLALFAHFIIVFINNKLEIITVIIK